MFIGLFHISYYLRNLRLYNPLCLHSLSNLQEACDVRASYIITFLTVLLGSLVQAVEDVDHDTL